MYYNKFKTELQEQRVASFKKIERSLLFYMKNTDFNDKNFIKLPEKVKEALKQGQALEIIELNGESWRNIYTITPKTQKGKYIGSYFSIFTPETNPVFNEKFTQRGGGVRKKPTEEIAQPSQKKGGVIYHYGQGEETNDTPNLPAKNENNLMAVFSELFAPDDPASQIGDCSQNPLKIAIDSEFMYTEKDKNGKSERGILSYQFAFTWNGQDYCAIYKYGEPRFDYRVALTTCIGYILEFLRLISDDSDYLPIYSYYELKNLKLEDDKFKQDRFHICIICHAGKADLTSFYMGAPGEVDRIGWHKNYGVLKDGDTVKQAVYNPLKFINSIQGGFMSLRPSFTDIRLNNGNDTIAITFDFRDTMGHAPASSKSLATLGDMIGIPKVEIGKDIENMDNFYNKDPKKYTEYSLQDALVTLKYADSLYKYGIPVTTSAAGAKLFKTSWMLLNGIDLEDDKTFNAEFRGLKRQKNGKAFYLSDGGTKVKDKESLEPLSSDIFDMIDLAGKAYCGGLNACFTHGWESVHTYDFDLQGAYPTALSTQYDIDYSQLPAVDIRAPFNPTVFGMNPFLPYFAYVDFKFPDDCKFPCIPVRHEGSLIFPLKGEDIPACGPDLLAAYYMGAKIFVKKGITPHAKMPLRTSCGMIFKDLIEKRAEAKRVFGKKSPEQELLKLSTNSIYGKMAQGVISKTSYSPIFKDHEDIGISAITNPCISAMATSIVRATLFLAIYQLDLQGYKTFSVTTDGFITNAPENVVKNLDLYGFKGFLSKARLALSGSPEIWEIKHEQAEFLNFCTRGNVAPTLGGVCAHNSYKTGEIEDSLEDRKALIEAVLERSGAIPAEFIAWNTLKDIYENGEDFSPVIVNRFLRMDYDFKRKPINPVNATISLYDKEFSNVHFDTKPYDTLEEYICFKKAYLSMDMVKTAEDVDTLYHKASVKKASGADRVEVYLTSDTDRSRAVSVLRGYRSGKYSIPAFDGKNGSDIVLFLTDYFKLDKPLSSNDWKMAGKKTRAKTLPYEIMYEVVEDLEKLTDDEFKASFEASKALVLKQNLDLMQDYYTALYTDYFDGLKVFKSKAIEGVYLPFTYAKGFGTFKAPSVKEVDEKLEKEGIFIKSRAEKLYKKVYKNFTKSLKTVKFRTYDDKDGGEYGYLLDDKLFKDIEKALNTGFKALIDKERNI